jgi:hypothetical protein
VKQCPKCSKSVADDSWLCDCGHEFARIQPAAKTSSTIRPTRLRAAFVVQLIFGIALLPFSSSQFRMGRFDFVALFCIILPPVLVFCAVGGLRGERWALLPSAVAHSLLCLAAARFLFPELFYLARGIDRGWAGPLFVMVSAPIFVVASILAVTFLRRRANFQSTGNA